MDRPKCPKCGTRDGFIRWVGKDMDNGYWEECQHAWHDKDRDPFRYGYPDDGRGEVD